MPKIIGIIPARYSSTRFPGKMLATILGVSLIQRTYENAKKCLTLKELIVATDDQRIFDHVMGFGGKVVMTSPECPSGTDRLAEAIRTNAFLADADIIVNIQGDEPCIDPHTITKVALLLNSDPEAAMSTAVVKLTSRENAANASVVKCVMDQNHNALYFSRNLIPAGRSQQFRLGITYYHHVGIYAFRRDFLQHYAELEPTPLQLAEDLEQLKVLEHGYRIKTAIVDHESIGVDQPEDIKKIEEILCKQNTSS